MLVCCKNSVYLLTWHWKIVRFFGNCVRNCLPCRILFVSCFFPLILFFLFFNGPLLSFKWDFLVKRLVCWWPNVRCTFGWRSFDHRIKMIFSRKAHFKPLFFQDFAWICTKVVGSYSCREVLFFHESPRINTNACRLWFVQICVDSWIGISIESQDLVPCFCPLFLFS